MGASSGGPPCNFCFVDTGSRVCGQACPAGAGCSSKQSIQTSKLITNKVNSPLAERRRRVSENLLERALEAVELRVDVA